MPTPAYPNDAKEPLMYLVVRLGALAQTTWTVVRQAAQGLRDRELIDVCDTASTQNSRQMSWLNTRMKAAAPQALIVPY